jgi:hypothetical protein
MFNGKVNPTFAYIKSLQDPHHAKQGIFKNNSNQNPKTFKEAFIYRPTKKIADNQENTSQNKNYEQSQQKIQYVDIKKQGIDMSRQNQNNRPTPPYKSPNKSPMHDSSRTPLMNKNNRSFQQMHNFSYLTEKIKTLESDQASFTISSKASFDSDSIHNGSYDSEDFHNSDKVNSSI